MLHNNFFGGTGLLRLSEAGSAAVGTFRVSLMSDWFTTSDFLCTSSHPCGAGRTGDKSTHFGTTAALSVTPLPYLEVFGSFRSYANSNDLGRPKLLQVLGDSILGVRAFMPVTPDRLFRFGGEAQLLLVNGTGGVGLDGGGTGARLRGLATADFTGQREHKLPLRLHANLGYRLDNSGKVVEDTEASRGGSAATSLPITRIERFGLGINRVDFFEIGLGAEGVFKNVRPFIEYTLDAPMNRQSYVCNKNKATTQAFGDDCLGAVTQNGIGLSSMPSHLTLGARGYPFLAGFAPMAALDIGITGTSKFIEEVAPTPPWTLYIGFGYATDIVPVAPVVKTETIEHVTQTPPAPEYYVRGVVHEQGATTPVSEAVVRAQGQSYGYATSTEGKFETNNLPIGSYTFTVHAAGYKDGTCTATVTAGGTAPAAPVATLAPNPFVTAGTTVPTSGPTAPAAFAPTAPAVQDPNKPKVTYVDIDCPLEALPRMGNLTGTVKDEKSGAGIGNVSLTVTLADGTTKTITTDGSGAFRIADTQPGEVTIKAESDKYMLATQTASVKPREDSNTTITLTPRPKTSNVVITGQQIVIRQQIHFETDSAVIKSDSNGILAELADALVRAPKLKRVEIQGHTDNNGTAEHNMELSQRRATSVREWLTAHGVEGSRLDAKGYGQTRPLAPNVTERNRARNRRVQFQIVERAQ